MQGSGASIHRNKTYSDTLYKTNHLCFRGAGQINVLNLNEVSGFRNHVIVLLLLDKGIRLSELANLEVDIIDFKQ